MKVSLVYPADATPGHLLSVVPVQQLARLHRRKQQQRNAQLKVAGTKIRIVGPKTAPPPPEAKTMVVKRAPVMPAHVIPAVAPAVIRSQQQWLLQLQGR